MTTPPLDDILTQFTVVKEQKDLIDWCTLYYRELTVLANTSRMTFPEHPPKRIPRVFPCLQSKNPPKWPFLSRRRYKKAFFSLQPPGGAKNPLFWRFLTIFDPFLTVCIFPRFGGPPPGMQKPPKRGGSFLHDFWHKNTPKRPATTGENAVFA